MCDVEYWNLESSLETNNWAKNRDDFEFIISVFRDEISYIYVEATEESVKEYYNSFPFVTGYKIKENVSLK